MIGDLLISKYSNYGSWYKPTNATHEVIFPKSGETNNATISFINVEARHVDVSLFDRIWKCSNWVIRDFPDRWERLQNLGGWNRTKVDWTIRLWKSFIFAENRCLYLWILKNMFSPQKWIVSTIEWIKSNENNWICRVFFSSQFANFKFPISPIISCFRRSNDWVEYLPFSPNKPSVFYFFFPRWWATISQTTQYLVAFHSLALLPSGTQLG